MRNKKITILFILFIVLFSNSSYGERGDVYIVPINGDINKATYNYIDYNLGQIEKKGARAIIFDIDTYGGRIDMAEKIKNRIVGLDIPTISFVNTKAESAGVLIAIASEKVAMSSRSSIGSAQTIPDTEKVLSVWRTFLGDTAEYRGRDAKVIVAMADKDLEIPGLSPRGKLVNLNADQAIKYGIADTIADNYEDILEDFSIEESNMVVMTEDLQMKLAKQISNPHISTFLLTMGFIGLLVEILTPGFGVGGTMSILGFSLYFGGNILAGNAHWTALILFITGAILLVIEGVVPGFGLPGISGIILLVIGIVLAMDSLSIAIYSISIAVIITTIIGFILVKLGFRSNIFDKVVLKSNMIKEKGYTPSGSKELLIGKEGKVITDLKPVGFIDIEGKRYDGISKDGYIESGVMIEIVKIEGQKIFVRRM